METGGRRGEAQRLPEKRELERYAQDQLPMPPELNRDATMRSRRERSGDNRRGASNGSRGGRRAMGRMEQGGAEAQWRTQRERRRRRQTTHKHPPSSSALSGGCAAGLPDADGSVESEGDGEGGLSGGEAEKGPWRQKSCPVTAKQARGRSRKVGWPVRNSLLACWLVRRDSTCYQGTRNELDNFILEVKDHWFLKS